MFSTLLCPGEMLVGSKDSLAVDLSLWESRIRSSDVTGNVEWPIADGLFAYPKSVRRVTAERIEALEPNRDLFPRDKFQTPK